MNSLSIFFENPLWALISPLSIVLLPFPFETYWRHLDNCSMYKHSYKGLKPCTKNFDFAHGWLQASKGKCHRHTRKQTEIDRHSIFTLQAVLAFGLLKLKKPLNTASRDNNHPT